jgi:hypothetical protein
MAGKIVVEVSLDDRKFTTALDNMGRQAQAAGRKIESALYAGFQSVLRDRRIYWPGDNLPHSLADLASTTANTRTATARGIIPDGK